MVAVSTLWAAAIAVGALLGVGFMAKATHRLRHGRLVAGTSHGLLALVCLLGAALAVLLGGSLVSYERLTAERPVVRASFARSGDARFNATLTYPSGAVQGYVIRGDDWQIDARVLKWRAPANVLGFDTVYRLERISGRYADIERERNEPRTVYALHPEDRIDTWALVRAWHDRLPWVDALYGSAAYVPMADGAAYEVSVSQSGLVARPLNGEARLAVGGWQ
jgi:hypothetical protein